MRKILGALVVLLLGCGIMALLVGLLWDRYSWQTAVICMAGFWVAAFTIAALNR